jgi:predicted RNase H-like nuclease (RuvC/YqgF family)
MAGFASRGLGDNIFPLPHAHSRSGEHHSSEALDLVYQAAEVIRANEQRAAKTKAETLDLARRAIERLESAEKQLRSAYEAERTSKARAHTAETNAMRLEARVEELEKLLRDTQSLVSAMQTKLSNAELRAKSAEAQATQAKTALVCVENAIRTQLLGERRASESVAAAA